jgi:hypothetical protein
LQESGKANEMLKKKGIIKEINNNGNSRSQSSCLLRRIIIFLLNELN